MFRVSKPPCCQTSKIFDGAAHRRPSTGAGHPPHGGGCPTPPEGRRSRCLARLPSHPAARVRPHPDAGLPDATPDVKNSK
jgi:hypothetical protein